MKGWIPPLPLVCGIGSFGLSWIVLFAIARAASIDGSFLSLAWVHLVALGWITTVALSVLFFALPTFLDVDWSGSGAHVARACTIVFALAALALALGFWIGSLGLLQIAGSVLLATLIAYAIAMAQPLGVALRGERVRRAIARAFTATLGMLVLAAVLGAAFTFALGGRLWPALLVGTPQAHALLAIGGWLTLLVFGVSSRTMGPIAGARSRFLALHIGGSSLVLAGTLVAAIGAGARTPLAIAAGGFLVVLGTIAYAADIFDVIGRATVAHRPPQAWMIAGASWAIVAATLLFASALGAPLAPAAIYVALIGWVGSAVLAHLHHIGVRVLLTARRGDDDETRPEAVLCGPMTWATFGLYELAALLGATAIAANAMIPLECASIAGLLAFVAIVLNAVHAGRSATLRKASIGA